jgi:hypothetical protein
MRTSGTHTTLRSSRSAMLCSAVSPVPQRVEIHGQQFAPVLQGAVQHFARHAQVVDRQVWPRRWRATRVSSRRRRCAAAGNRARRR